MRKLSGRVSLIVTIGCWALAASTARADLIHHWKLDEISGLFAEDSASGSTGRLMGFPDNDDSQWIDGQFNGGLDLGANFTIGNYIDVDLQSMNAATTGGSFTICMWLNPGDSILTPGEYQLVSTPGDVVGFTIMNFDSGGVRHDRVLLFWDGNLPNLHVGTTTLEPGTWYHIAITSTGDPAGGPGAKNYYVNGVLEKQALFLPAQGGTQGNHPQNNDGWAGGLGRIGAIGAGSRAHNSIIDDVRIYDEALSAEQLMEIIENPPLPSPRLVDFIPEAGEFFHEAGDGFRFKAQGVDGATIDPANIKVAINDVDVSTSLTIGGTPESREVRYEGLVADTNYVADIEVTDSRGAVARRQHSFGTLSPCDDAGLVHHFKFDEAAGTVAADCVTGVGGTLVNFGTDDAQWVSGVLGNAIDLGSDGSLDNFVRIDPITEVSSVATGGYTVSMLVNPGEQVLTPGEYQLFSTPGDAVGVTIMNTVAEGTNFDRVVLFWDSSAANIIVSHTTLEPGTWYHVAVTSTGSGGEKRIYVNGVLEDLRIFLPSQGGSGVGTADGWSSGIAQIGAIAGSARAHDSRIDDFRIYDFPLSDEEIEDLVGDLPEAPQFANFVPADGDAFHSAAAGLSFEVSTSNPGATIPTSAIHVTLNGTDVSGQLVFGGTETARTVSFQGLQEGTLYAADIAVADSTGAQASRRHEFGTLTRLEEPGLLIYYPFDEQTGLLAGDRAGGTIARLQNFENNNDAQWVDGQVAGAVNFGADGSNNNFASFNIPAVQAPETGGFSVALWINPSTRINTPGEYQIFSTPGDSVGLTIMNTTSEGVRHDRVLLLWDSSLPNLTVGTTSLEPGTWYHVAVTSTGGGGEKVFYINGRREEQVLFVPSQGGTGVGTADGWVEGTAQIAGFAGANRTHGPIIDEFRVYNRVLEDDEVAELAGGSVPLLSDFVPADGAVFHDAAQGLAFTARTDNPGATIAAEDIRVVLNGTDVSGALAVSGPENAREVLYDALAADTLYEAEITVTDSIDKTATSTIRFGTFSACEEPGLIHRFQLDETSGLAALDCAAGSLGSLVNFEPDNDSQWVDGQVGGALDFGTDLSANNYVSFQATAVNALETGGFTIALWINPGDRLLNPGEYQLVSLPGDTVGLTVMNGTFEGRLADRVLLFWDGNLPNLRIGTTTLEAGTWYHVAVTSTGNGGERVFYVNGEVEETVFLVPSQGGEDIGTSDGWGAGGAQLGGINGANRTHNSVLDDVRIYDRPLEEEEIAELASGKVGGDPRFVRGDADGSGGINITDGVFVLNFLFQGGGDPPCKDAADADNSNGINITDGVYVLNFLFQGGPDPAAPYPACGTDPDADATVDCAAAHAACV